MTHDDDTPETEQQRRRDRRDQLWQQLRQLLARADPVPPAVLRSCRESYTWRTVHAELAELVHDSAVDHAGGGVTRGPTEPRLLTFEAPGVTVEVEVTADRARRRLVGQLVPPQPARVTIRHREGTLAFEVDEHGRFRAEDLPAGPSSLRFRLAGAGQVAPIVTDWTTI